MFFLRELAVALECAADSVESVLELLTRIVNALRRLARALAGVARILLTGAALFVSVIRHLMYQLAKLGSFLSRASRLQRPLSRQARRCMERKAARAARKVERQRLVGVEERTHRAPVLPLLQHPTPSPPPPPPPPNSSRGRRARAPDSMSSTGSCGV